jgi:hypothetical protein
VSVPPAIVVHVGGRTPGSALFVPAVSSAGIGVSEGQYGTGDSASMPWLPR